MAAAVTCCVTAPDLARYFLSLARRTAAHHTVPEQDCADRYAKLQYDGLDRGGIDKTGAEEGDFQKPEVDAGFRLVSRPVSRGHVPGFDSFSAEQRQAIADQVNGGSGDLLRDRA